VPVPQVAGNGARLQRVLAAAANANQHAVLGIQRNQIAQFGRDGWGHAVGTDARHVRRYRRAQRALVDALGVGWGYATYAVNALARARATRLTKLVHFTGKTEARTYEKG
jgi:hypothetical protein